MRASPTPPRSVTGLKLEDAYITATAHCAHPDNKPTRQEIEACRGYLVRELEALADAKVVLVLGRIAFDGFLAAWRESSRVGSFLSRSPSSLTVQTSELPGGVRLLGSYHPSQQEHVYRKAHSVDVPPGVQESARSRRLVTHCVR